MAVAAAFDAPRRRRRRDARDNDALILDAAVGLAATEGWHGLLASRISAATGLSNAPVRERFADRGDVAAALWRERLSEPFFDRLGAVVAATPSPGEGDVYDGPQALLAAMEPFQQPDEEMLAAAELLVMSRFDSRLGEVVAETWAEHGAGWLTPQPGVLAPAQAARQGFALSLALGLLLVGRGFPTSTVRVDEMLVPLARALAVDAQPQPLPAERAEHLDLGAVFATDDPAWDALLQATLDEVGARGYEGATLELIARSAGYSRGIIQNRYSSKKEIVLDATRRMLAAAVVLNEAYTHALAERYGQGLADAAFMREVMDPSRRLIRAIACEQIHLAWYDPDVAAVLSDEVDQARESAARTATGEQAAATDAAWHFGLAAGQGAGVLADLHPQAASLPFDVVTVPLNELD